MRTLRACIAERQASFARHPLFAQLDRAPADEVLSALPRLAFWVMAFQDVLRLNERLVTDPALKRIARHHKAEDAGHERWFLDDLAQLAIATPDLRVLFGAHHRATRDATYALVAEVFRAESDLERIVLVLVLESTGHVFFDRVSRFVEAHGLSDKLRYFSDYHLEIEHAHSVFEERMQAQLDERILSRDEAARMTALVDRSHAAFQAMFDGLFGAMLTLDVAA